MGKSVGETFIWVIVRNAFYFTYLRYLSTDAKRKSLSSMPEEDHTLASSFHLLTYILATIANIVPNNILPAE